ncbi:MAG TPA: 4Fe-4S dicluster domain-containing protein [Planctomycetes bacterium]|nr:4Fe-4S dicluster domain-containing protein [Planctomycetota bacterium]HIN80623.1 4Fe-4S dicluster domain-containing protein [Planctomycetota bacterium]
MKPQPLASQTGGGGEQASPKLKLFTPPVRKKLRLTNVRIVSQIFFFGGFILLCWLTWTSRLEGYPVSRLLEMDPLVMISTMLSTGYVYRFLGWGLLVLGLTLLAGRVFCNWICPYGTLHQFVGWLFNVHKAKENFDRNRYRDMYYFKYAILTVLLIMSSMGALQIGLLDPICLMYRTVTTVVAPAWDMTIDATPGVTPLWIDDLKFAPGVQRRVFVGSFWIGLFVVVLVGANVIVPRFFCRLICPLGALLGVFSRVSLFRINRDVHKCTDCNLCLTRCEGAADPQSAVRVSECFSCMNCIDDCPEDALSFSMVGLDTKQVKLLPDVSRRRMLFSGIIGALGFPLLKNHGTNTDANFSPMLIRPPGSVEESEFLEKCIKCDQCINSCPTNVLQPATWAEGGLEGLWSPVMNFNIAHCQLKCTLCSEVCPTGAIRKITVEEKLGKGEFVDKGPIVLGTAFFDLGRCLPHAMQIPCVVCEEVCPVSPKAIQTHDEEIKTVFDEVVVLNKPFIVPELCIGCGICQAECPVRDQRAVYVTAVGESRSTERSLLLKSGSKSG